MPQREANSPGKELVRLAPGKVACNCADEHHRPLCARSSLIAPTTRISIKRHTCGWIDVTIVGYAKDPTATVFVDTAEPELDRSAARDRKPLISSNVPTVIHITRIAQSAMIDRRHRRTTAVCAILLTA